MKDKKIGIWFPTVRTNTGTDVFTRQLVQGLNESGIRAEITWLPLRAEYLPWTVEIPRPPEWATILHTNTWLHSRFLPKNLPLVTTLHHCVQDKNFEPYKTKLQKIYHNCWITPIERKNIMNANVVTTVSHYTATCAEQIFALSKIDVIYNSVNLDIFKPKKYRQFNYTNKFKLLFVGTTSRRKGFDLVVKIMQQLGGEYELYFTSQSKSHSNLPSNMKPLPYIKTSDELADIYNEMDALLFPSRLEGFGLVVAEAMACGLPPIVAHSSALPELVDHYETGIICSKDDEKSFIDAIQYLKKNPLLVERISANAITKAKQMFNIDDMINAYIRIYKNLVNVD